MRPRAEDISFKLAETMTTKVKFLAVKSFRGIHYYSAEQKAC